VTLEQTVSTDPVFSVLDVRPVAHAAAPTLAFDLHVSDPAGRAVHTIALSAQVQVDPARRTYDAETKSRLMDLFGAPERWGATTHSFQWARVDVLVGGFTGATSFQLTLPCSYDLELAAVKYFYSLPGGEVPLSFHFTGMVLYAGEEDRLQVAQVPWSCSAKWMIRLTTATLDALLERKAARGDHRFEDTVAALLEEGAVTRVEADRRGAA